MQVIFFFFAFIALFFRTSKGICFLHLTVYVLHDEKKERSPGVEPSSHGFEAAVPMHLVMI